MIGTEAQFSEKRCTLAMVMFVVPREERDNLASGRGDTWRDATTKCIGSRCAQWCWYDYVDAQGNTNFVTEASARDGSIKGRRTRGTTGSNVTVPARGYCGLTGSRE
jgi:hypothetical protein